MSGGFSNPVVDQTGNLQITSVQSPGFTAGPPIVGWQIDKNGQAFFQSISVGSGVQRIFVQSAAPTGQNVNDIWVQTSNNNQFSQWNGTSWVAFQWGTAALAPGAVTLSVLAAGIVYAHIVDGTEIDGSIFRAKNSFGATIMTINKSAATWILYSDTGSATQGVPIAWAANTDFTDEFSNALLHGSGAGNSLGNLVLLQDGMLRMQSIGSTPTPIAANVLHYVDTSNYPRYISGDAQDTTSYFLGESILVNTSAQSIVSTTPANVVPFQFNVGVGQYYFSGIMRMKQGATNSNQLIGLSGPTQSSGVWYQHTSQQAGANGITFVQGIQLTTVTVTFAAANDESYWYFDGTVTFSTAGTLTVIAAEGSGAVNWVIQPGSFMKVRPMR